MNKTLLLIGSALLMMSCGSLNTTRLTNSGMMVLQAVTLSDDQIISYAKEFITASDLKNSVCPTNDPYAIRLNKIAGKFNNQNGINIKVYKVKEVNAFACADGSIRVYSGLMDIMSDSEILGVIGHEIGHIQNKDTKEAFKNALINSALKEGIASTSEKVAALTDTQLGALGEAYLNARYSQKQEFRADEYGYNFLKSNGDNPWAMALSFEKLHTIEQQAGANKSSAMQQLFSTHPDIEVRLAKMTERATQEGYTRPKK